MERVFEHIGTESTLEVHLNRDLGNFIFKGESRPENAVTFFEPLLKWLEEYCQFVEMSSDKPEIQVDFELEYFNSTSYKYILDVFKVMKKISLIKGVKVKIDWKYDALDLDILESGNDFAKWTDLEVEFIAK